MPVLNLEIADQLDALADLAEIEGENRYRVRAYRRAARTVAAHPDSLAESIDAGLDLTELSGIGDEIAAKIREFVETGRLSALDRRSERVPRSLRELLRLPGLGAKQVRALHAELGVRDLDELAEALAQGRVEALHGFGAKRAAALRTAVEWARRWRGRTRLDLAEQLAAPLRAALEASAGVRGVWGAGSLRRRWPTVGDIDLVVASEAPELTASEVAEHEDVVASERDARGIRAELRSGLTVEARIVEPDGAGAALLVGTGSRDHVAALAERAERQGRRLHSDGLYAPDGTHEAGADEPALYRALGLAAIPPELRENRGEIAAAEAGTLPELVTPEDLQGDLQMHTTDSDGAHSLAEMAEAARARGLAYIAVTDHSQRVRIANGLTPERLAEQGSAIAKLNQQITDITILASCEVDILTDGSLDLPDETLAQLDLVVGAVHAQLDRPEAEQTERLLRAIAHPELDILAHPTGQVLQRRPPLEADWDAVFQAAAEQGVALEINAAPQRLDLDGAMVRRAKAFGVRFVVATDAHSAGELDRLRYGVEQARRGWLSAEDVVNAGSLTALRAWTRRSRTSR